MIETLNNHSQDDDLESKLYLEDGLLGLFRKPPLIDLLLQVKEESSLKGKLLRLSEAHGHWRYPYLLRRVMGIVNNYFNLHSSDSHLEIEYTSDTMDSHHTWCEREIDSFIENQILVLQEMDEDEYVGSDWYRGSSFEWLGEWYYLVD